MSVKPFMYPQLTNQSVDRFGIRTDILRALIKELHNFRATVLDVGCGIKPYQSILLSYPSRACQYVGLDFPASKYGRPDLAWDGREIPLRSESIDSALATEVLEHSPEPAVILSEAYRVLRMNGFFFFTVPFLWPLHDTPYDFYRYTPYALSRLLDNAGFREISIVPLGGWDASLAQMIGLWVRRRPMSRRSRKILSHLAVPIVRYLRLKDYPPTTFPDNTMATGFAGRAVK